MSAEPLSPVPDPATTPATDLPAAVAAEPSAPLPPAESALAVAPQSALPPAHGDGHSHGHGHGPTHTHCENCGTELKGPYCHACGQHDFDAHRSFGHTFLEALENFFHFDAKFFRNIITLLFRPGVLTAEFIAGKRAAQMPPFRLYIFVSVLFFFINFVGREPESAEAARATVNERSHEIQQKIAQGLDAAGKLGGEDTSREMHAIAEELRTAPAIPPKLEPATPPPRVEIVPGFNISLTKDDEDTLGAMLTERGRHALEDPRVFRDAFVHALPKMLLFCLPLFALYTRVLFRRSGPLYLQHLIIALHFHTFIFLFLLTRNGWINVMDLAHLGGFVRFAANLWLAVYPFLMLRQLFRESWPWTLAKTVALTFAYGLTLLVAFWVTVVTIFLLL